MSMRVTKDIQDITLIWEFLDLNNLLTSLPRFFAEDMDRIRTARFEDGDIRSIFNKLDKILVASMDLMKTICDWRSASANFA